MTQPVPEKKKRQINIIISIVMYGHVLADLSVTNCLINKSFLFIHIKPSTVLLDNQHHRILWLPKEVHAKPQRTVLIESILYSIDWQVHYTNTCGDNSNVAWKTVWSVQVLIERPAFKWEPDVITVVTAVTTLVDAVRSSRGDSLQSFVDTLWYVIYIYIYPFCCIHNCE